MSYETLKSEISKLVETNYQNGMRINDIRAAIHAIDLMVEQWAAIEVLEIAKSMQDEETRGDLANILCS